MIQRMSKEEYDMFRGRVVQFLYKNGITINGMARQIGMSHLTLRNFIYGRTKPYWVTIGNIERFIDEYQDNKSKID